MMGWDGMGYTIGYDVAADLKIDSNGIGGSREGEDMRVAANMSQTSFASSEQTPEVHLATAVHVHKWAHIGEVRQTDRRRSCFDILLNSSRRLDFAADFCLLA